MSENTIDRFEEFWNSITVHNAKQVKQSLPLYATTLLQLLIVKVIHEKSFEIGMMYHGHVEWSIISYKQLDSDKELSIRYNEKGFDLYFNYFDGEDYDDISYPLTENYIEILPVGLQNLMKQALHEKGMVVKKNTVGK